MKRNAILLQEAYRRDGHADFIKRASEVCGVPRSTLKKWRQQHLNGIYLYRILSNSGYTDTKRMTLLK